MTLPPDATKMLRGRAVLYQPGAPVGQGVLISAGGLEGSLGKKASQTPCFRGRSTADPGTQPWSESPYLGHLVYAEQPGEFQAQHLDTRLGEAVGVTPVSQRIPLRALTCLGYQGGFPERGQARRNQVRLHLTPNG